MTFPERTRSECAVLACCGVMVPETSLRLPVRINWWNPPLILLGQFFRWSRNNRCPSSSAAARHSTISYGIVFGSSPSATSSRRAPNVHLGVDSPISPRLRHRSPLALTALPLFDSQRQHHEPSPAKIRADGRACETYRASDRQGPSAPVRRRP